MIQLIKMKTKTKKIIHILYTHWAFNPKHILDHYIHHQPNAPVHTLVGR